MKIGVINIDFATPLQMLVDVGWTVEIISDSGVLKLLVTKNSRRGPAHPGGRRFLIVRSAENAEVYEPDDQTNEFFGENAVQSAVDHILGG